MLSNIQFKVLTAMIVQIKSILLEPEDVNPVFSIRARALY
jgi:hypothetical protein